MDRQSVAASEAKKNTELNNAREAIYSALSKWVGETVQHGEPIPVYREGKRIGTLSTTALGKGREVEEILEASKLSNSHEIREMQASLSRLADISSNLLEALRELGPNHLQSLENSPKERSSDTNVKVIQAIGIIPSTFISLTELNYSINSRIENISKRQGQSEANRGRPKNAATHGVAFGLAKLYACVCGKKPGYSEGPSGLTGDYTPALRSVFDALGWPKTCLKGPAEAAISEISDDDLDAEIFRPVSFFTSAKLK